MVRVLAFVFVAVVLAAGIAAAQPADVPAEPSSSDIGPGDIEPSEIAPGVPSPEPGMPDEGAVPDAGVPAAGDVPAGGVPDGGVPADAATNDHAPIIDAPIAPRTPSIGDAIDPLLAPPPREPQLPILGEPSPTSVEITWRVENPFRFFPDAKDTEVHRATYLALSPEQRASAPVLAAEHALARRHESGWAETMYRKSCWSSSSNRYVCPDRGDYINPGNHKVVVTLRGMPEPDIECRWVTAELHKAGESAGPESVVTQPCGEPMLLAAPYPSGLSVRVEVGGIAVASTEIKVRDLFVVGLGDSFGSGEGNPDVPVRFSPERTVAYGKASASEDLGGYPARVGAWKQVGDATFVDGNARWLDQACHRSLYSHQFRAALELAVEDPHRAVTFAGFACSGAEVTWGLFLRYKGNEWVPHPPDLSQISAAADAQCGKRDAPEVDMPEAYHMHGVIPELMGGLTLSKCPYEKARKIDLLLMSVGGNDIGFARLVANAVLSDESLVRSLGGWFGQVHGNAESQELLTRLDQRYKAMNRAAHGILHVPWDESDRIILTAYPPFALLDDTGNMCRDGSAGMEVFSEFKITQKAALSSSWLADKLDQVMEKSAEGLGWSYADAHRKTFVGRGVCAGHTNGLGPLVDDLRMPRRKDGVWQPYNPAHYEPYASRLRWFRTPNDAFLTGNFHAAGSVMQKVLKLQSFSWFQVLLAATYGGAFHPTAEGQAAMADAVVARARDVLARHGQQSPSAAAASVEP